MSVKLVRSRIQEAPGFQPCGPERFRKVHNDREHVRLLARKMLEECAELIEAAEIGTSDDIVSEAGDLIAAIHAYVDLTADRGPVAIRGAMQRKRDARGDFYDGLVWEHP